MRSNFMRKRRLVLTGVLAAACLLQNTELSLATTATSTFTVQLIINSTCTVSSPTTLDFGTAGILSANIDATTTISVTCTASTTYNIGLNAGTGTGATVATRKMTSSGNTVNYTLYSDSARTTVWGNTIGTDTPTTTPGTGSAQSYTVYGRVPSQVSPAAGTYTDTITVTVTY